MLETLQNERIRCPLGLFEEILAVVYEKNCHNETKKSKNPIFFTIPEFHRDFSELFNVLINKNYTACVVE